VLTGENVVRGGEDVKGRLAVVLCCAEHSVCPLREGLVTEVFPIPGTAGENCQLSCFQQVSGCGQREVPLNVFALRCGAVLGLSEWLPVIKAGKTDERRCPASCAAAAVAGRVFVVEKREEEGVAEFLSSGLRRVGKHGSVKDSGVRYALRLCGAECLSCGR
jgi:hypothetical protein